MAEAYESHRPVPILPDPWERDRPIPLNGVLEHPYDTPRQAAFWRIFQALAVLVFAFILFQAVSSVVAVLLLLAGGVSSSELLQEMMNNLGAHVHALMVGNTLGQVVGLALPALLLAGLHSSRRRAFLRLRPSDGVLVVLAVMGLAALTPVVMWLGNINSTLPMPDWVEVLERSQMQLIEQLLSADTGLVFNLVVLALTPAFCEEFLFRGYVQRQAERGLGAVGGILFSGILFGLYHFRLTQALPLIVLGLYLAYLVWRTGSLWPAIVVHFANNAYAVLVEAYVSSAAEPDLAEIEQVDVPWYLVLAGMASFALVVYGLQRVAKAQLGARHGGTALVDDQDIEERRL